MMDIIKELNAIHRRTNPTTLPGGEGHAVRLSRSYDAAIDDVWEAITNPKRLERWFLPVEGELRLGGHYKLKGNAGGKIVRCEPPRLLEVTWAMGPDDGNSKVEVRLSAGEKGLTLLELEHAAIAPPGMWEQFGPGAVGLGWDLTLLGLALDLRGIFIEDKDAWGTTPEAGQFMEGSSEAWCAAHQASGADAEFARKAAEATLKFYRPNPT